MGGNLSLGSGVSVGISAGALRDGNDTSGNPAWCYLAVFFLCAICQPIEEAMKEGQEAVTLCSFFKGRPSVGFSGAMGLW